MAPRSPHRSPCVWTKYKLYENQCCSHFAVSDDHGSDSNADAADDNDDRGGDEDNDNTSDKDNVDGGYGGNC